ncbi:hypothetical protein [Mycobacterium innocens]|uniref:hypothetical protein n=1 Tax=Mycobacterium innocens TaxID=2341083 RepID=UPI00142D813E|nr:MULTISPECIES: hypothetical protein [Mycobacterium]
MTLAPALTAAKKHGLELLDADTLAALKRDAQEGRRIAAAGTKAKIEAAVDDAVNRGKITAARRKHWDAVALPDRTRIHKAQQLDRSDALMHVLRGAIGAPG